MANEQNLKPFKKGPDPRRNRKGRPKDIPGLRALVLDILHEVATDKTGQPLEINGHAATVLEAKLRQLIQSRNSRDTQIVFDYAFGKVPAPVEVSGKDGAPLTIAIVNVDVDKV
jgi:hypothetical protein